ncbi:MAG: tRNA (guanine-N(7)-)-methyltransferase [Catillopecten margaritatus gill symbiont]|uniref:tRNA (guanine-N(7)-)-methyltransferase n=1 Tax=Catillopecten margaritatus gill symbiont TaxID=3083288 RepID=A0AAU6PHF7_9GAMM
MRRSGRLTLSQKRGLTELWADYSIESKRVINFETIFGNDNPVVLEIGFGNGDTLVQMAQENPQLNYVGIEVYEAGIGRLISGAHSKGLTNLKVLKGDAVAFLTDNIADNSLSKVQLFFPDPWHKKKHHKRRIVQQSFLDLLSVKLRNGAKFHLATDWAHYAEQMMEMLEENKHFKNTQPAHIYTPRPDFRPLSKFEKRGHRLGHGVWDLIFINEKS